jgi:ubiquitin-protein ligase E3 C
MFVNDSGLPEAGIDAGGVFKEFLSTLAERAFDENLGLFLRNPAAQLYPNPDSAHVVPMDTKLFEFVGSVLGKAVFEGIQVASRASLSVRHSQRLNASFHR